MITNFMSDPSYQYLEAWKLDFLRPTTYFANLETFHFPLVSRANRSIRFQKKNPVFISNNHLFAKTTIDIEFQLLSKTGENETILRKEWMYLPKMIRNLP